MPFVSDVPEDQAPPDVKETYAEIRRQMGFLPNTFTALGRDPEILKTQLAAGAPILRDGAVPRLLKEQIGIVVSGLNTSSYCVALHMEFLRQFGIEKAIGRKLAVDYPNAPVGERDKALFRFADKLTKHPEDFDESDVQELRKHGWDEAAVFETVLVVSFFNFVNRVSIGLGLVADF